MSRAIRLPIAFGIGFLAASCATTSPTALAAGGEASIEGTVVSIHTQPWAYDGNAVIYVDTLDRRRVSVQLPARWNLCKAAPVDLEAVAVGSQVRVRGTVGTEGEIVVCQGEKHRMVPVEM